jgi:pimeloyl-ACP methyl ester carboxylesterase
MSSTTPFVELPDARVHYATRGAAGSPVLLVMGFGVPGHMWLNQIDAFIGQHRVAWFDNAGAGQTTRAGRSPASIRDLARHAVAVLDALGWERAHVVGVSMGGMIAQELALGWKDRVRSLSLVATHAGGLRDLTPPSTSLLLFGRAFLGPRAHRARELERLIFPDEYLRTVDMAPLRRALRDQAVAAAPARDRLRQIAAIIGHRTAPRLHQLAGTPTLVVKASRDRLIRPSAHHRLHRLIPGSRLIEFEDAGHAILHQCANRLNDVLLDHFAAVDRT